MHATPEAVELTLAAFEDQQLAPVEARLKILIFWRVIKKGNLCLWLPVVSVGSFLIANV